MRHLCLLILCVLMLVVFEYEMYTSRAYLRNGALETPLLLLLTEPLSSPLACLLFSPWSLAQ